MNLFRLLFFSINAALLSWSKFSVLSLADNPSRSLLPNCCRKSSDGKIQTFFKDTTEVGSIHSQGGDSFIVQAGAGSGSGLHMHGANGVITPARNGAVIDNPIDLGGSSNRFKDIYLSGGVNFSANANASGMSSELLDDYEEGTFTPVITGSSTAGTATVSHATGNYTKVGRIVTVNFDYAITAHTGSGSLYIGGLPFATTTSSGYEAVGTFMSHSFNFDPDAVHATLYVGAEQSFLRIYITRDNASWTLQALDTEHSLIGAITYMAS